MIPLPPCISDLHYNHWSVLVSPFPPSMSVTYSWRRPFSVSQTHLPHDLPVLPVYRITALPHRQDDEQVAPSYLWSLYQQGHWIQTIHMVSDCKNHNMCKTQHGHVSQVPLRIWHGTPQDGILLNAGKIPWLFSFCVKSKWRCQT